MLIIITKAYKTKKFCLDFLIFHKKNTSDVIKLGKKKFPHSLEMPETERLFMGTLVLLIGISLYEACRKQDFISVRLSLPLFCSQAVKERIYNHTYIQIKLLIISFLNFIMKINLKTSERLNFYFLIMYLVLALFYLKIW